MITFDWIFYVFSSFKIIFQPCNLTHLIRKYIKIGNNGNIGMNCEDVDKI